ncbi:hypothetical protein [Kitasatospora sp. NPDC057015]|uniref:hypothetical protein n=1 Tax=Kitasatospora sp. NPDC057015 TaxID=3346001 RepID=UPI0036327C4D
MRTPGFPRLARQAAFAGAALVIGAGLPLTVGGATAHACGDAPRSSTATAVAPTTTGDTAPRGATVTGFIPVVPTAITAGGPKIEIGVEEANLSGAPMERVAPGFALYDEQAGGHGTGTLLHIEELSVEVMFHGRWTPLELHYGCDPVISADTSALAEPLADGRAHRFLFRVGLSAQAPADRTRIQVYSGVAPDGRLNAITLTVAHPADRPATAEPSPTVTTASASTATSASTDSVAADARPSAGALDEQSVAAEPVAPRSAAAPPLVPAQNPAPAAADAPAGTVGLAGTAEATQVVPLAGEPAARASAGSDTALLWGGLALALLGAGAAFVGVRLRARR